MLWLFIYLFIYFQRDRQHQGFDQLLNSSEIEAHGCRSWRISVVEDNNSPRSRARALLSAITRSQVNPPDNHNLQLLLKSNLNRWIGDIHRLLQNKQQHESHHLTSDSDDNNNKNTSSFKMYDHLWWMIIIRDYRSQVADGERNKRSTTSGSK